MITQKIQKSLVLMMLILLTFISIMPLVSVFQGESHVEAFSKDSLTFTDGVATVDGFDATNGEDAWKAVIDKYKEFIVGIGSVATVTFIIFFILNITKVAATATNPMARGQAIMGVVWTGIAAALLGSVTIWFGFFYNSLRGDA